MLKIFGSIIDQGNFSMWIKQKSTGMIYTVGQQSYYRHSNVDWVRGTSQDSGDNPSPMQVNSILYQCR